MTHNLLHMIQSNDPNMYEATNDWLREIIDQRDKNRWDAGTTSKSAFQASSAIC